jgi:predicted kinase
VVTNRRLILLSGIPATGKTCFGRWVSREHDFIHVENENKRLRESLGLEGGWSALKGYGNTSPLIAALQNLGPRVLFDG